MCASKCRDLLKGQRGDHVVTAPPDIETFGVFSNDGIDMEEPEVYGFDYDYTLASYNP